MTTPEVSPLVRLGRSGTVTRLGNGGGGARAHSARVRPISGSIGVEANGTGLIRRRLSGGEGGLKRLEEAVSGVEVKGSSGTKVGAGIWKRARRGQAGGGEMGGGKDWVGK